MCGIFGAIKKERGKIDIGVLRALTLANRERGKESLGFFDSNGNLLKKGDDPIDVLAMEECTEFLDDAEQNSWFVVGHTRYSTRGKVCDENSHPFQYGEVTGAHNGIIDAPYNYSVDSEYAIDLLDRFQSDYQNALEAEYGYWTLAWYDNRIKELFVSMYDNTCGVAKYRGVWYFSSDPDHLFAALGNRETYVLENGNTVSFDSSGKMKWRKKFKSKISYSYKKDYRTAGGKSTTSGFAGASSAGSYGNGTGWPEDDSYLHVNDPERFIRDYDQEFKEIWAEYASQYEE